MTTKVLCAVDGSDHANKALMTAAELAQKYGADLIICFVNVQFGRSPLGAQVLTWTSEEAERILSAAKELVVAGGYRVTSGAVITDRAASSAIIQHAQDTGADHIVIGTGDKHGLERLVLGSVAKKVATRAPCTVTIAR
jgi:nucleotide-binding universal stress UspA family protein